MTDTLDGFALPLGARSGPNCGVTAVAIIAGISFDHAWKLLSVYYGPRWKGKTNVVQRAAVLEALGVKMEYLITPRRRTLEAYARLLPAGRYMVRTTGHVQLLQAGMVLDQGGVVPVSKHWGRRKLVSHVVRIVSVQQ